jgi:dolichyl-phosphate-mannose--protein O-mannosyl transferase
MMKVCEKETLPTTAEQSLSLILAQVSIGIVFQSKMIGMTGDIIYNIGILAAYRLKIGCNYGVILIVEYSRVYVIIKFGNIHSHLAAFGDHYRITSLGSSLIVSNTEVSHP